MYFSDLKPYRYGVPAPIKDVVTVGWLSKSSNFPVGKAEPEFTDGLARLLSTNRVNLVRGHHVCEFCLLSPMLCATKSERLITLGSAEIWLPSPKGSIIFAAPDMIYHYVTNHDYVPPNTFVEAVLSYKADSWNAALESEKRLNEAFQSATM